MPIYAYKCGSCGHAKDVLQKISDAPLTDCPQCGASTFSKQVTAAGFQLKGSGWYVTDFRGGNTAAVPPANPVESPAGGDSKADSSAPAATPAAATSAAAAPAPAAPAATSTASTTSSTSTAKPS
ncbi:FmdB family zinc ribbon protein [Polaromonas sp. YR568]|uniref:FmdB family zinc ribbon protein n=1 Tax=Polaromonas sp. YR568 TaxID=1855301 RepID=UPI0031377170